MYGVSLRMSLWLVALAAISLLSACDSGGSGDECVNGESQCYDSLSYQACSNGIWSEPISCKSDEICKDNACQNENTDPVGECEQGDVICVGELIQSCGSDNMWDSPQNCPEGEICKTSGETSKCEAKPQKICDPGDAICFDAGTAKVCNTDGTAWSLVICQAPTGACMDGGCEDPQTKVCEPNTEKRCKNGMLETCDAEGHNFINPTACDTNYVCQGGECVPVGVQICTPKTEKRCADNTSYQVCNDDGMGWSEAVDCPVNTLCKDDGACRASGQECIPNMETRCTLEGLLQICNDTGSGWSDPMSCPPGYSCDSDRCLEGRCEPGKGFKCTDDLRIRWCNETGDGYLPPVDCPLGKVCAPGSQDGCGVPTTVCKPNSKGCNDDGDIITCKVDGSGWEDDVTPCPDTNGQRCIDGLCATLCDQAALSNSYFGCEYWPVVLANPQLDDAFKSGNESEFAVVISNTNDKYQASVTIESTGDSFKKTVTVNKMSDLTVRLPYNEVSDTFKGKKAFHLTSSIPVTVYQFNPLTFEVGSTYSYTNDASLLLPTHVLGLDYMVINYRSFSVNGGSNTEAYFTVVGTEDGTKLTIIPHAATLAGSGIPALTANQNYSATINRGEVIQISAATGHSDSSTCFSESGYQYCLGPELTGSVVQSDKPVAVYGANECSFVPHYRWACDHLEEQLFPTGAWTTQYIAGRLHEPVNNHPNIYKIVALFDETEIVTKPENVLTQTDQKHNQACTGKLNRGQSCIIQTMSNFIVVSNPGHPISVAQFLVGQNFGGLTDTSTDQGDPSMVLVPPVEQFRYDYIFLVPATYKTDYVTFFSTKKDIKITLDNNVIPDTATKFKQIGGVNAYIMEMTIADGSHSIHADSRLGIVVYGYDSYVSYAYPAGLDLSFIPY